VAHEAPGQTVVPQAVPALHEPPEHTCPEMHAVPPASQPEPVALQVRTVFPSQPGWFGVQIRAGHVPLTGSQY
jgi:hypothetical protein